MCTAILDAHARAIWVLSIKRRKYRIRKFSRTYIIFSESEIEENWQPETTEEEPNRGIDFLDTIMDDYKKEVINRGALSSLHKSLKGELNTICWNQQTAI